MIYLLLAFGYFIGIGAAYKTLMGIGWDKGEDDTIAASIFWPVMIGLGIGFGLSKAPGAIINRLNSRQKNNEMNSKRAIKLLSMRGVDVGEYRQLKELCNKFEENLKVIERE